MSLASFGVETQLYRQLQSSPLAVVQWSSDFTCQRWSKRAEEIFGWKSEEVIGRSPTAWRFIHEDDEDEVARGCASLIKGSLRAGVQRQRNYTRSGRVVECEWYNTSLADENGRVYAVVSVALDVAGQNRSDADLTAAKRAAEAANELKSAFIANMSHEIRTPLGAILGFSELLADSGLDESARLEYLSIVKRNGQHLCRLIDDILDLSKVEADKIAVERARLELPRASEETFSTLSVLAEENSVRLEIDYDDRLPDSIVTDAVRFQQIVTNVVGNAIKFTPKGTVKVRVATEATMRESSDLVIRVVDTGIGIDPVCQEKPFQPFVQSDSVIRRGFGGSGLGLALSRRLARLLGGDVRLRSSEPGKGSEFEIRIDTNCKQVGKSCMPCASSTAKISNPTMDAPLHGLKILVAEDAPDNQALIERMLCKRGASVAIAQNGDEVIVMALEGDFDLVLMDIQMPMTDGYLATQRLRSRGYLKPVIALTAHAMKEERNRCLSAGCDDHIAKPVNSATLVSAILSAVHGLPAKRGTAQRELALT